jgi:hypothetical protein
LSVFTAFHLGCRDFDDSHHKPPALTVFPSPIETPT